MVVIIALIGALNAPETFNYVLFEFTNRKIIGDLYVVISYLTWLTVIFVALHILYDWKTGNALEELGLKGDFLKGLTFAFSATIPMWLGYYLVAPTVDFSLTKFIELALLPGFMEELLFRGFAFGQLYKKAGWGFIPAVALSAFFFAAGHIYQATHFLEALLIFLITFMGAGWFAWLYVEWDQNLWVPIGLHVLMNASWSIFHTADNVLGGISANAFRILTIIVTVVVTLQRGKRKGGLKIRKHNLFFHKSRLNTTAVSQSIQD